MIFFDPSGYHQIRTWVRNSARAKSLGDQLSKKIIEVVEMLVKEGIVDTVKSPPKRGRPVLTVQKKKWSDIKEDARVVVEKLFLKPDDFE